MNNLTDKEKIFLLTYELQHAVSTVQFLHDCLVNPEHVKYGYPYMTLNELEFWKTILPKEQYCLQHAGLYVMKKEYIS